MRWLGMAGVAVALVMFAFAGCKKHDSGRGGAGSVAAAGKAQTTCPVMEGNPINRNIYADYEGKRVYFCCGACPPKFREDPEKYIKKLEDAGVEIEKAPAGAAAPASTQGDMHEGHEHPGSGMKHEGR
jgi:YHS domain-containing protein